MAYAGVWPFVQVACLVPVDNRLMKPHAYARALHLVDWRRGLFELRPVLLLTSFFWYAPTDFGGLEAAGKRDSFGSCTDPWLNLSARHIRYWIPARTHLPKNLAPLFSPPMLSSTCSFGGGTWVWSNP